MPRASSLSLEGDFSADAAPDADGRDSSKTPGAKSKVLKKKYHSKGTGPSTYHTLTNSKRNEKRKEKKKQSLQLSLKTNFLRSFRLFIARLLSITKATVQLETRESMQG